TTVNLASNTAGTAVFSASMNGAAVSSLVIARAEERRGGKEGECKGGAAVVKESGNLASGTQTESVSAAAAARFVFVSSGLAGASFSTAGMGRDTVYDRDWSSDVCTSDLTTVNLASNTAGTAVFSASLNGAAVSSLVIA